MKILFIATHNVPKDTLGAYRQGETVYLYSNWAAGIANSLSRNGFAVDLMSAKTAIHMLSVDALALSSYHVIFCITLGGEQRGLYPFLKNTKAIVFHMNESPFGDFDYAYKVSLEEDRGTHIGLVSPKQRICGILNTVGDLGVIIKDVEKDTTSILIDAPKSCRFMNVNPTLKSFYVDYNDLFSKLNAAGLLSYIKLLGFSEKRNISDYYWGCEDLKSISRYLESIEQIPAQKFGSYIQVLKQVGHFVVTTKESLGGSILDALSCETVVHYPNFFQGKTLIAKPDLSASINIFGFQSYENLVQNLKTKTYTPCELLSFDVLAKQIEADIYTAQQRKTFGD